MSVAQRLRQKLLDLAIHGKLVPQCAKDEPAGELLARIRKARNAGGGRTQTSAAPLPIPEEEIPFDLPRSWVWCRLGEVCEVLDSKRKPITKCDRKPGPYPYYGATSIQDYVEGYIFDEPLLLLGEDGAKWGPGEASAFLIYGKTWVNNHAHVLRIDECAERGFICYALESLDLMPYITGTTVPKLNQARMCQIVVPLPPLAEQKRIVEKLDGVLNEATRIAEGTERLALLRKKAKAKILDLAIRGKLVKQEKSDEPASELLKRIAAEKAKLVAEKEIRKEKPLPPIADDEIPFDLPKGWAWARIGDISSGFMYGTAEKSQPAGAVPVLRMGNLQDGEIDFGDLVYTSNKEDIKTYALTPGDLLFNRTNSDDKVGKVSIFRDDRPCIYAGYLVRFRPLLCDSEYINYVMNSHYQWTFCQSVKSDAVNQSNISASKFVRFLVPIPPLAEQHRIVAKVKEMLAACDALGGEG